MGNAVSKGMAVACGDADCDEALGWCSLGSPIRDMDISPDQTRVLVCSAQGLYLWELATGRLERFGSAHVSARTCRWSPDGQHIAVGFDAEGAGERLQVLDATTGDCQVELGWPAERPYPGVNAVAFSPDSRQVFAAAGHRVLMWPLQSATACDALEAPATRSVPSRRRPPPVRSLVAAAMAGCISGGPPRASGGVSRPMRAG
jgi:WD40 repeat protein